MILVFRARKNLPRNASSMARRYLPGQCLPSSPEPILTASQQHVRRRSSEWNRTEIGPVTRTLNYLGPCQHPPCRAEGSDCDIHWPRWFSYMKAFAAVFNDADNAESGGAHGKKWRRWWTTNGIAACIVRGCHLLHQFTILSSLTMCPTYSRKRRPHPQTNSNSGY